MQNWIIGLFASMPLLGCGASIAIVYFVTIWTDRNLDFWCTHFAHHPVDVPTWMSFILAVFGNAIVIVLNVIAEIARLF